MRSARGDVRDHVAQGEVFLLGTSPASDDRGQGVVHCFCKPLMLQRQRSFPRGCQNGMIQINAAARLPPKVAHGIKTAFHHRSGRARDYRCQRGYNRPRPVLHVGRT